MPPWLGRHSTSTSSPHPVERVGDAHHRDSQRDVAAGDHVLLPSCSRAELGGDWVSFVSFQCCAAMCWLPSIVAIAMRSYPRCELLSCCSRLVLKCTGHCDTAGRRVQSTEQHSMQQPSWHWMARGTVASSQYLALSAAGALAARAGMPANAFRRSQTTACAKAMPTQDGWGRARRATHRAGARKCPGWQQAGAGPPQSWASLQVVGFGHTESRRWVSMRPPEALDTRAAAAGDIGERAPGGERRRAQPKHCWLG